MDRIHSEDILRKIPNYREYSHDVSRGIHSWILGGGYLLRKAADFFHGSWLGHPLHPVLTDVTIGAWVLGSVFDLIGLATRSRDAEKAADQLTALGTISAVPTAVAGITDFTVISPKAMTTGATHGLANLVAWVLYLLSSISRKSGNRGLGLFFSGISLGLITVSGWLGGELVYRYQVSTNKTKKPAGPEDWQAVLDEQELGERAPKRVEVEGNPVLLYRLNGAIYAIGAVCAHDGGPLDEGNFDGYCVECPWHQSVYDLRDGSVVHGPSTYAEPSYETRSRNGKVEIRLKG